MDSLRYEIHYNDIVMARFLEKEHALSFVDTLTYKNDRCGDYKVVDRIYGDIILIFEQK